MNTTNSYGVDRFNIATMLQNQVWTDKSGKVWYLQDLADRHLEGIIKWLEDWWARKLQAKYSELLGAIGQSSRSVQLRDTPLMSGLKNEVIRREREKAAEAERVRQLEANLKAREAYKLTMTSTDWAKARSIIRVVMRESAYRNESEMAHRIINQLARDGYTIAKKEA